MVVWLVTVRTTEDSSAAVSGLLTNRLLPLLRANPSCSAAILTRCVNCPGEYTYLAYWNDPDTVESFENTPAYQAVLNDMTPCLCVHPKRELWQVLAEQK